VVQVVVVQLQPQPRLRVQAAVLVVIGLLQAKHFPLLLPTPLQLEPGEPGAVVGQTKALEDQTVATRYFLRSHLLAVAVVARVTCFPQHPLPEVGQMVVQVVALAAARTPQTRHQVTEILQAPHLLRVITVA
jgi:hypothetical protein